MTAQLPALPIQAGDLCLQMLQAAIVQDDIIGNGEPFRPACLAGKNGFDVRMRKCVALCDAFALFFNCGFWVKGGTRPVRLFDAARCRVPSTGIKDPLGSVGRMQSGLCDAGNLRPLGRGGCQPSGFDELVVVRVTANPEPKQTIIRFDCQCAIAYSCPN